MSTQVIMPQLGESVVEGTIGKWLIAEGQPVKEYEPLVQVTTDKVDTEIPAPASGILLKIYVPEGETVAKGTVLAEIGAPGSEGRGQRSEVRDQGAEGRGQRAEVRDQRSDYNPQSASAATPVAQRVAAEHGVDLGDVPGTGPGGRVTKEDVKAYLAFAEGETPSRAADLSPRAAGFISPAVGRLAAELGVDLAQVVGTGAGGRITKKDVLAYAAAPVPRGAALPSAPEAADLPPWERPGTGDLFKPTEEMGAAPGFQQPATGARQPATGFPQPAAGLPQPAAGDSELIPFSVIRRSIAKHMLLSKQTSPHVTTVMEADMTPVVRARERLKGEFARQGVKLTFTPFFIQAIVAALKAVPEANSSFTEAGLLVHRRTHIGMAVAIPDGLIVPVIRDADERSLLGLARAVNDLADRARTKQLKPEEVQGGTFTLTNHGTAGSLFATPIINQPQAGILGVGAIEKRAVVLSKGSSLLPDADDVIAIRPMAYLSFAFDHRILDGQEADGFLMAVVRFLEGYAG